MTLKCTLITFAILTSFWCTGQKVGIGVTAPQGILHIQDSAQLDNPHLRLTQTENFWSLIHMENLSEPGMYWRMMSYADSVKENSRLIFYHPNQGNILTITGNSNVGISAVNPHEMLEIGYTGRMFIGDGGGDVRKGLLIDAIEPNDVVRIHPYDYGNDTSMTLFFPTTVGIGSNLPHHSSILDVQSTQKGILIPRMTQAQRLLIGDPAEGLMVFQTDEPAGFWFFRGAQWNRINTSSILSDLDNDTRIQVEATPDEDMIRFDLGGTQRWVMTGNRIEPSNTGESIFIGKDAGKEDDLSLNSNVFIGDYAGQDNTSGFWNVGIGTAALIFNTDGSKSVAIGFNALSLNGPGTSNNTAIGFSAMTYTTSGNFNTACGTEALNRNTTGSSNVAVGSHALTKNTTGELNVAVGASALEKCIAGDFNTVTGQAAMRNSTSGHLNSAFGNRALENSNGARNTAIGGSSLLTNISGSDNTALGNYSDVEFGNLTHATAIGANAIVSQSYSMVLGDPDTTIRVGIGTSKPPESLSIVGDEARLFVGDNDSNTRTGLIIDGNEPDDYVRIHAYDYANGTMDINIPSSVLMGIWGGTTSYTLELAGVAGTAAKPGGGTWTSTSDRRLKQDIRDYTDGLDALMQIRPVRYRYTEATGYNTETEYVGVIAQELEQVTPYMVSAFEKEGEEFLAVDASSLTYLLINAVQEQQEIIRRQQAQIDELRGMMQDLAAKSK